MPMLDKRSPIWILQETAPILKCCLRQIFINFDDFDVTILLL